MVDKKKVKVNENKRGEESKQKKNLNSAILRSHIQ